MKKIVQRNLPLDVKYVLTGKKYIPIEQSAGAYCCNDCGKLIANIATVKNDNNESYDIGFDCLEKLLINNMLMDGKSIEEFYHFKKHINSYIKKSNEIKEIIKSHNAASLTKIVNIEFDISDFMYWSKFGKSSYLTFYYIYQSGKKYNSNIKVSNDINIDDFIYTFETINNLKTTKSC
jgi:hypothetical protein